MSKPVSKKSQTVFSPTSQMAFAVALCALAAAGIGSIVNYWLTGWMAVGGMAGVGLFYLAIGLLNLRSNAPAFEEDAIANVSQRTARVENLIGEAISHSRSGRPSPADLSNGFRIRNDDDSSEFSNKPRHQHGDS